MPDQLLSQSEIAFRVGVTSRTVRGWIARGELAQKGTRTHAFNQRKAVALYSLAAAQRLAQLHHERKARRKKRSA